MTSDAVFFDRAVRRIHWAMLWLTIAIAVFVFFWGGWPWVVGYLAGAVASMFNFRWLHQLVSTLGQDARRPRKRLVLFPGGDHGWDMLDIAAYRARASAIVIGFLRKYGS